MRKGLPKQELQIRPRRPRPASRPAEQMKIDAKRRRNPPSQLRQAHRQRQTRQNVAKWRHRQARKPLSKQELQIRPRRPRPASMPAEAMKIDAKRRRNPPSRLRQATRQR
jgi:hypothetical protein